MWGTKGAEKSPVGNFLSIVVNVALTFSCLLKSVSGIDFKHVKSLLSGKVVHIQQSKLSIGYFFALSPAALSTYPQVFIRGECREGLHPS